MSSPARRRGILAAVVAGAAGATLFQFFGNANHGYIDTNSLFYWWIYQWWNPDSETQHGWLVLGIAAWLLWRNVAGGGDGRAARPGIEEDGRAARPYLGAAAALVAALALHAVGFVAQQARVSIIALLLFLWGVVRLGGGRRWGAAAAFPLAFLVFAIPLNVLDSVGFWLRLWVIRASTAIAHGAGVAVLRNGTQLVSPDGRYNYDVAAACSGVRSLMALAALSLLLGYLSFRSWWRRALMLALCFPLVYVGNVARITAIVFAAQRGGTRWGDIAHEVMGYAIFAIVLGGVLGAARVLERWWPEGGGGLDDVGGVPSPLEIAVVETARSHPLRQAQGPEPFERAEGGTPPTSIPLADGRAARPYLITTVVVAIAVAEGLFLHHLAALPPRGLVGVTLAADGRDPVELPAILGREWFGTAVPVSDAERAILPPDTGYSKIRYVSAHGAPPVFVSIVLSGKDRTSIHRPELCLVGQGWTIEGAHRQRFSYPASSTTFPATVLRVTREARTSRGTVAVPQLVAYWFVAGDAVVSTHWHRMALDAWNRVAHARADRWAYVLMQTDATDGEPAALARMQAILDRTLPSFQRVR